jgi:hypothetical protein
MNEIHNRSASPPTAPTAPDAPAQAAMTSLPHATLDTNAVNKQVTAIFEQAGLVRGADGGLQVKDTAALGKTTEVKGLANFEQVYGAGESQLKPPAPPRVQLTEAGRVGAESFATSMDRVIDDILVRPKTQQAFLSKPESNTAARAEAKSQVDAVTQAPSVAAATPAEKTAQTSTTGTTKSLWKLAQEIQQSPAAQQYRAAMAANTVPASGTSAQQELYRRMTDLTADVLLAAFLKLNIMDPNNSVETHQRLHTVMSKLRQRAIADAKQKMKVAAELRKEAEKAADSAAYVSNLMSTIRIIVCLVALVCAIIMPAFLVVIAIVAAIISCATTIVEAAANKKAQVATCDAAQSGAMAKRALLMADRAQEQIEEEAEMIKVIIESKNKMVESVMRMLNAMFGASQKLMSAGMAKG